ncbi:MAG: hypothetical protein J7513_00165 [Solirubrobacteraceae bacterium]|nr:hypothetical protein [Solirubrobacteraceae bacterium]
MSNQHDDPHRDDALWEEALEPAPREERFSAEQPNADRDTVANASGPNDAQAPQRGRRRRAAANARVMVGLGAVILVAGGFAGGVLVQQGRDDDAGRATTNARAGFPGGGQLPGGGAAGRSGGNVGTGQRSAGTGGAAAGGFGGFGGGNPGGGMTVGEVANVKGGTIYVTTSDGTTVRVVASTGATVQRTAKATMTGVHPGDTVIVSGEADADGTVKATSVRASSSDASGR